MKSKWLLSTISIVVILAMMLVGGYSIYTDYQVKKIKAEGGVSVELFTEPETGNQSGVTKMSQELSPNAESGAKRVPDNNGNKNKNWYKSGTLIVVTAEVKEGYTFSGWYKGETKLPEMEGQPLKAEYEVTGYTELTAKTTVNNYTVDYNLNGGALEAGKTNPSSITVEDGDITLNNPVKEGYDFTGWTGSNGNDPQTKVIIPAGSTGEKTYTANWTPTQYKVNYDPNGGELPDGTPEEGTYDVENPAELPEPTRPGYTFDGWAEDTDGDGDPDKDPITEMPDGTMGDKDFIAEWTPITYTIAFNGNGGKTPDDKPMEPISMTYDEAKALPANTFEREGYTFAGWAETAKGTVKYTDKQEVSNLTTENGKAVTLYAAWEVIDYTITYQPNGGTLPADADTSYNVEDPATLPTPTKNGYEFRGWFEDEALTDGPVTSTDGETGNKTYYAKWEAKGDTPYTVRHWQQTLTGGATHNDKNFTLTDTDNLTGVTDAKVTPNRKVYEGFTAPAGQELTITADGKAVVDYYYTRNSYQITLTAGKGIASVTGAGEYKYGASVTINATASDGYKWDSWTGDKPSAAQEYAFTMPAADVSNTANAVVITYNIKFDPNGGELPDGTPEEGTYDVENPAELPEPTRPGYTFDGWAEDTDGDGDPDKDPITEMPDGTMGDKDFIAQWTPITYTVTFNGNGGTAPSNKPMDPVTMTYDAPQNLPANTFEREGYVFAGWATSKENADKGIITYADKEQVTNLTDVNGGNVSLFAVWKTPMLAANSTWFSQGGTTIKRSQITKIDIVDTYDTTGKTIVDQWDASDGKQGTVTAYVESDGNGYKLTLAGNGYGKIYANPDSKYAFSNSGSDKFSKLTAINGAGVLDTSKATNFGYIFSACTSLETLDVSSWNTSNVTDMQRAFAYCVSLPSIDVGSWDVGNVTNMYYMFASNESSYGLMKLTSIGDVGNWNTSNVNTMGVMFQNCSSLESLNVSNWDVGNVTDMHNMFYKCNSLVTLDVSNWDTGNVTNMRQLFDHCTSLETLDVSNWDTGKVTTFMAMFQGNAHAGDMKLKELDVSNWNTSSATNMDHMFYGCGQLTEMDLSKWDVSKVTTTSHMFADCFKMERYNFSGWNTASLTDMGAMFNDNDALTSIDVSDFDTGKITVMSQLFEGCEKLETIIGLDKWDTSSCKQFVETFKGCTSLTVLDLSAWDTSSVQGLHDMFCGCSNLETIYVSDLWTTDGLLTGSWPESNSVHPGEGYNDTIFYGCSKLVGGNGTAYADDHLDYTTELDDRAYAQVDGKDGKAGYLTNNVHLSYEDVEVGSTVDADVTIKSKVFDSGDNAKFEVISGSEFASVDASTGKVTGIKEGTATIKITLTNAAGETIFNTAEVKVFKNAPMLAANSTWFSQGGTTIKRSEITKIDIVDTYDTSGKTIVDQWDASTAYNEDEDYDNGPVTAYVESDGNGGYKLTLAGNGYGKVFANPDSSYAFSNSASDKFSKLTAINGGTLFDTSKATNMGRMFQLSSVKSVDVSNWDVSNVTDMNGMFDRASSLESLAVENWKTGNVTAMNALFQGCISLTSLDLSNWDVSQVTTMKNMFMSMDSLGAMKLTSIGDVGNWKTGKVTTMQAMFQFCSNLVSVDVSNWDTGEVSTMQSMFKNCSELSTLDVSKWNTSSVTNMSYMFAECQALKTIGNTENWKTGNVSTMLAMFHLCTSLESLDVSNWDVSKVTTFAHMFQGNDYVGDMKIKVLDVSNWNTPSATDMTGMFYGCGQLTEMDLSNWDVSKVMTMSHMFTDCFKMESYNLSGWNTASLTNMNAMFNDNDALISIDVSDFDTANVTNMSQVFEGCENLETIIGLENWDVSKNITFQETFGGCKSLTELNLSSWDTSSAKYLYHMFTGCSNLETIYVSDKWSTESLAEDVWDSNSPAEMVGKGVNDKIFDGCTKLVGGNGTAYAADHVDYDTAPDDSAYAIVDGKDGKAGYLTNNVHLSYDDVEVGGTVDPDVTIKSKVFDSGDNAKFEVISGSEFASVDASTGKVTGIKEGTATIKITLTNAAGETIFNTAEVKVKQGLVAQALYSEADHSLVFVLDKPFTAGETFTRDGVERTITQVYTGVEATTAYVPWSPRSGEIETVIVADEGIAPVSTRNWFSGFSKCTTMDLAKLDVSKVTDMYAMFSGCTALTSVGDLSGWNITTAENINMAAMFKNCKALTSLETIYGWDTSNVANMAGMFEGCSSLTSLDLSGWQVGNVNNLSSMFSGCTKLTSVGDISDWDTGNVEHIQTIFYQCKELTGVDLTNWDTSKATDMSYMFAYCEKLATVGDLSGWTTSNVENMRWMFNDCHALTSIGNVSNWNTAKVTDMSEMFYSCSRLTALDLSGWNTSNVTKMSNMFAQCYRLTTVGDLSGWDTSKVSNMNNMFYYCSELTELNLSGWDTSSDTNMTGLLQYSSKLEKISLGDKFAWGSNAGLRTPTGGYWYDLATGTAYAPADIPSNTAATYVATDPGTGANMSGRPQNIDLSDEIIAGEPYVSSAMPDVSKLNAIAATNAPENTVLCGWRVDSGFAKEVTSLDDFEDLLHSVYDEASDYELTLTPLYQKTKEDPKEQEEPVATEPESTESATEPTVAPEQPAEPEESEVTFTAETGSKVTAELIPDDGYEMSFNEEYFEEVPVFTIIRADAFMASGTFITEDETEEFFAGDYTAESYSNLETGDLGEGKFIRYCFTDSETGSSIWNCIIQFPEAGCGIYFQSDVSAAALTDAIEHLEFSFEIVEEEKDEEQETEPTEPTQPESEEPKAEETPKAEEYAITYEANGGTMPEDSILLFTVENTVTLPTPSKDGHTFKGWYESADFSGDAVTEIAAGTTGNKTFYAAWEASQQPTEPSEPTKPSEPSADPAQQESGKGPESPSEPPVNPASLEEEQVGPEQQETEPTTQPEPLETEPEEETPAETTVTTGEKTPEQEKNTETD